MILLSLLCSSVLAHNWVNSVRWDEIRRFLSVYVYFCARARSPLVRISRRRSIPAFRARPESRTSRQALCGACARGRAGGRCSVCSHAKVVFCVCSRSRRAPGRCRSSELQPAARAADVSCGFARLTSYVVFSRRLVLCSAFKSRYERRFSRCAHSPHVATCAVAVAVARTHVFRAWAV